MDGIGEPRIPGSTPTISKPATEDSTYLYICPCFPSALFVPEGVRRSRRLPANPNHQSCIRIVKINPMIHLSKMSPDRTAQTALTSQYQPHITVLRSFAESVAFGLHHVTA